jgi:hypothetical protein
MEPPDPTWWRPELHAPWFHITADGQIACETWTEAPTDRARWRLGNCFPTRAQAEHARANIREAFRRLRPHET